MAPTTPEISGFGGRRRLRSRATGWRGELPLFAAAYVIYDAARWLFAGNAGQAEAHARRIVELERSAHIAIEGSVQRALDFGAAGWLLSNVYLAAQLAILPVALVWLYRRSPPVYRRLRDTILGSWLIAVPIFALFPVAPPRLAGIGIADTVTRHAAIALTGRSTIFYNQFAAVPSLHVGFASAIGIAAAAALHRRWAKALALLWGPTVALAVVATGNHYVVDIVAGLLVTGAGFTATRLAYLGGRTREMHPGADDTSRSLLDHSHLARRTSPRPRDGGSMSDQDHADEVIERLEWADGRRASTQGNEWLQTTRRTALTGGAAGLAAFLIGACGGGGNGSASADAGKVFGPEKKLRFTFINHVTTNPFFVPTRYGAADACSLLGCSYQWTGSQTSNVNQMVNAFRSAISSKVDGIAVSLVDTKAFNGPVEQALAAGIPVVAYNADAAGNARLAYIGQNLETAGQLMGQRIVDLVGSGDVALFIATPGALNIQPRINGAISAIKQSGKNVTPHTVATGAAVPQELSTIDAYWTGHKNTKGLFAVDGGSTQGVAQVVKKYNLTKQGVKAGGFDLLDPTIQLLAQGQLDFTIDQQPYLQGFLPILELFMYKASQTLSGTADVDTGLKFLTQQTVKPYVSTKSRFEGTSTAAGVTKT